MSPRRYGELIVCCAVCDNEIEYCRGVYGDWMHSATRRERGLDGHLAQPHTIPPTVPRRVGWRM